MYSIHGATRSCVCGAMYTDSDGGGCHAECKICGEITSKDLMTIDGVCNKCDEGEMAADDSVIGDEAHTNEDECPECTGDLDKQGRCKAQCNKAA